MLGLILSLTLVSGPMLPNTSDTVKLSRTVVEGEMTRYSYKLQLELDGAVGNGDAVLSIKQIKGAPDNACQVELTTEKLLVLLDGADTGMEVPGPQRSTLDKNGMPTDLDIRQASWMYGVHLCGAYLPGEVEVGKEFKIRGRTKSGNVIFEGAGQVKEVLVKEGKKVATVTSKINVTPNDDSPGVVTTTSQIDVTTGKLLEVEGKFELESGIVGKFTGKLTK